MTKQGEEENTAKALSQLLDKVALHMSEGVTHWDSLPSLVITSARRKATTSPKSCSLALRRTVVYILVWLENQGCGSEKRQLARPPAMLE